MAEIVDLDVVVPDDITFKYKGETYIVGGDIPTETVFRLIKLYQQTATAGGGQMKTEDAEPLIASLEAELLELFQEQDPDLEKLPFGMIGLQAVARTIFERLGFAIAAGGDVKDPSPAPKPKGPNRASRRSSGSRVS